MSERLFQKFHGNILVELEDDSYFWGELVGYSGLKIFHFNKNNLYNCTDGICGFKANNIIYITKIDKPYK